MVATSWDLPTWVGMVVEHRFGRMLACGVRLRYRRFIVVFSGGTGALKHSLSEKTHSANSAMKIRLHGLAASAS
jgi:hypothetical protein